MILSLNAEITEINMRITCLKQKRHSNKWHSCFRKLKNMLKQQETEGTALSLAAVLIQPETQLNEASCLRQRV